MEADLKEHWILGSLGDFIKDRLGTLIKLGAKGSVTRFRLLHGINYLVSDPDLIAEVLLDKENVFIKNTGFWDRFKDIFGDGLLTLEGERWRERRRLVAPSFQPKSLSKYIDVINNSADLMISRWSDGDKINIFDHHMVSMLNVVKEALLGISETDADKGLIECIRRIEDHFSLRINRPFAFVDRLPLLSNIRFWETSAHLDEMMFSFIEQARMRQSNKNVLDALISQEHSSLSNKDLRDELITLIFAGHDTTAITMSWMLYLLCINPEYWELLNAEWNDAKLPSDGLTFEKLSDLKLTLGVIKETLRLFPAAYIIGREAIRDIELGGTTIPKGKAVVISPYVVGRDQRFYSDPEKFDPFRWNAAFISQLPRFAFIPFGGGKRTCIGEQFAYFELAIFLWKIGTKWRMSYEENSPPLPAPVLTLNPGKGVLVRLHKRV